MKEVTAKEGVEFHDQTLSQSNAQLKADQPLYYSHSTISGEVNKVFASEEEVLSGGQPFDCNPLIFYRIKKASINIDKLPLIDLPKFYN